MVALNVEQLIELHKFQFARQFTNLGKDSLVILEELKLGGDISADQFHKYRKRILDKSNDSIREVNELIDKTLVLLDNKV